jgi:hypothetical protein
MEQLEEKAQEQPENLVETDIDSTETVMTKTIS